MQQSDFPVEEGDQQVVAVHVEMDDFQSMLVTRQVLQLIAALLPLKEVYLGDSAFLHGSSSACLLVAVFLDADNLAGLVEFETGVPHLAEFVVVVAVVDVREICEVGVLLVPFEHCLVQDDLLLEVVPGLAVGIRDGDAVLHRSLLEHLEQPPHIVVADSHLPRPPLLALPGFSASAEKHPIIGLLA